MCGVYGVVQDHLLAVHHATACLVPQLFHQLGANPSSVPLHPIPWNVGANPSATAPMVKRQQLLGWYGTPKQDAVLKQSLFFIVHWDIAPDHRNQHA